MREIGHVIAEAADIAPLPLPPYSPELNPVERPWHHLRSHSWSNRRYADYEALEEAAVDARRAVCLDRELVKAICAAPTSAVQELNSARIGGACRRPGAMGRYCFCPGPGATRFGAVLRNSTASIYMKLYLIVIGIGLVDACLVAALALGADRVHRLSLAVGAAGLAAWAALAVSLWGSVPIDFALLRSAGLDAYSGLDPYAPGRFEGHLFFNPPSALPLFSVFSLVPAPLGGSLWTVLNAAGAALLIPTAIRAIRAQSEMDAPGRAPGIDLPPCAVLVLTVAVALSNASIRNATLGQMSVLAALLIFVALGDQGRGRPIRAGLALALATVKVGTVVPFLLLFFARRSDVRTWLAAGLGLVALCLAQGAPASLPTECRELLMHIAHYGANGLQNDYTEAGVDSHSILGFDHAFYRVFPWNRGTIRLAQIGLLAALGVGLAFEAARRRMPRAALGSLVCLYAVVFLYHRVYDTVLLAFPLAFAVGRARVERGWPRRLLAAAGISCLLILNLRSNVLKEIEGRVTFGGPIRGAVLSYATWLVLATMACIWIASDPRLTTGPTPAGDGPDLDDAPL